MNTQTIALRYITFIVIAIMAFGISVLPASADHGGAEEEVSHSETAHHHDDEEAAEHHDEEDAHSEGHIMYAGKSLNADQAAKLIALLTQLVELMKQQKALLPN